MRNRSPGKHLVRSVAALVACGMAACTGDPAGPVLREDATKTLQARAERARGLLFREPVQVHLIRDEEVPLLLEQQLEWVFPAPRLRRLEHVIGSIGYLPHGTDLGRAILEFESDAVVGFYAPVPQRLFVVTQLDEAGRPLLSSQISEQVTLHELIHALQAQHSPLLDVSIGIRENFDLGFAIGALLEGDALWSSFRDAEIEQGTPISESANAVELPDEATGESLYPDTPRAIREPFLMQYSAGFRLAQRLGESGGAAALSAALLDPPLSSEQVLHPELYAGVAKRSTPFLTLPRVEPGAGTDCREVGRNTLGEIGLRIWFAERRVSGDVGRVAAAGWGGDRLVTYRCGDGAAFFWLIRFDSTADADEFADLAAEAVVGLDRAAPLRAPATVWAEGRDVVVSAGLAPALQSQLLDGSHAAMYPNFDAYLRANSEVLERAQAMRARAVGASGSR